MNGNTRALQVGDTVVIRSFSADKWPTWGCRGQVDRTYQEIVSSKEGKVDTYTPVRVKWFDPKTQTEEFLILRNDELVPWNGLDEILSFT